MNIHSFFIIRKDPLTKSNKYQFNDTHWEKLFYSIHDKDGCLATSDFFHMFTQLIKFYTFHYHVLKNIDV